MDTDRKPIARRLLVALAALAVIATACGGGGGSGGDSSGSQAAFVSEQDGVTADTIRWGLIYDQTGPTAGTQVPFAEGIMLAIEQANADGGVHGRTIDILEEDEKYEVPTGVAAYARLVEDTPVIGLTGMNNSSFQGAAIEDVDENRVPVLGAQSTTRVAVNPTREYFWAMQCPWADQADVSVVHAFQELGPDHGAVTVSGNVASGEEYAQQIAERTERGGAEYLETITVEFGAPNADAQAQRIARLEADVVHVHGTTSNAIPLVNSMQKFGLTDVLVIGAYGIHNPEIVDSAPDVAENFAAVDCFAFEGTGAEELRDAAEHAGISEDVYTRREYANGWVVGQTIVAALEETGDEPTRERLNAAIATLSDLDTGGLSPTVSFSEDDHIGIDSVKPFDFNPSSGAFDGVGEYADYTACIMSQYTTESLDGYDPMGCVGA